MVNYEIFLSHATFYYSVIKEFLHIFHCYIVIGDNHLQILLYQWFLIYYIKFNFFSGISHKNAHQI